jgi:hypothetical protein
MVMDSKPERRNFNAIPQEVWMLDYTVGEIRSR